MIIIYRYNATIINIAIKLLYNNIILVSIYGLWAKHNRLRKIENNLCRTPYVIIIIKKCTSYSISLYAITSSTCSYNTDIIL